jgi:enterobacterial common antigen flippase
VRPRPVLRHLIVAGAKAALGSALVALFGFVSTKVLALALGPAGIGVYSLLRQCLMTATVLATLSPQAAVAHAVVNGERSGSPSGQLSTVFWMVAAIAVMVVAIGVWCADFLAGWLLPDLPGGGRLIAVLAIPLLLNVAFVVLLNVLQAFRAVGAASVAAVAGAAATSLLAYPLGLRAAAGEFEALVLLLAVGPVVSVIAAAISGWRTGWLAPALSAWLRLDVRVAAAREFLRISGAGVLGALFAAAAVLAVRTIVANRSGLELAGIFDAAWTISHNCFGLGIAAFGSYYLPTLMRVRERSDAEILINQAFFLVTVAALPAVVTALAFSRELIMLLYSAAFLDAAPSLRWLLIGQCFRLAAWTLSFLALARGRMLVLVIFDGAWSLGFVAAGFLRLGDLPLMTWLGIAYAVLYALYFAAFVLYVRRMQGVRLGSRLLLLWCAALAIALVAAVLLGDAQGPGSALQAGCCGASVIFSTIAWWRRPRWLAKRAPLADG